MTEKDKERMLDVIEDLYEITHEAKHSEVQFETCYEAFYFYLRLGSLPQLKRGISMLKDYLEKEMTGR